MLQPRLDSRKQDHVRNRHPDHKRARNEGVVEDRNRFCSLGWAVAFVWVISSVRLGQRRLFPANFGGDQLVSSSNVSDQRAQGSRLKPLKELEKASLASIVYLYQTSRFLWCVPNANTYKTAWALGWNIPRRSGSTRKQCVPEAQFRPKLVSRWWKVCILLRSQNTSCLGVTLYVKESIPEDFICEGKRTFFIISKRKMNFFGIKGFRRSASTLEFCTSHSGEGFLAILLLGFTFTKSNSCG